MRTQLPTRRSLIGLLLGAPFLGTEIDVGTPQSPSGFMPPQGPTAPRWASRSQRLEERIESAKRCQTKHLPFYIKNKRSWSDAFKLHVHVSEVRQNNVPLWELDGNDLIKELLRRGYTAVKD